MQLYSSAAFYSKERKREPYGGWTRVSGET